jgi:uncharacterized Zn finger protein (UPF0148 family)
MAYCKICGVMISVRWGARAICPTCAEAERAEKAAAEKAAEPVEESDDA